MSLIIIKEPGLRAYVCESPSPFLSLLQLQDLVGGSVECIALDLLESIYLILNEEGKLLRLKPNIKLNNDIVVGTIGVISITEEGYFRTLTKDQVETTLKYIQLNCI